MTRYELLDRIGVGGMAEIFRGKAVAAGGFEKPVAIKRILPNLSQDRRFVELLIAEAKVLSLLKHRNIVQIFDVGLGDDGKYFLVMEFVDGKDLGAVQRSLEAKRRRIPFDLVLHIGAEICEALEHAHSARGPDGKPMMLVHRDVSPTNVLVSRAGEIKLTDFGIAKRAEQDATHGGAVRGKFAYISPEQARNEHLDPRSDVFSVGILMWELLCNRRLFSMLPDLEALRAVREAPIARPTEIDARLPPEIDAIVMAALSRDKTKRYATAGVFGAKLRSLRYSLETAGGDPATELAKIIESTAPEVVAPAVHTDFDASEATVVRIHTADAFSARDNDANISAAREVIDRFEEAATRVAQLSGDQLRMLRDAAPHDSSDDLEIPKYRGTVPKPRTRAPSDEATRARPPMAFDAPTHLGPADLQDHALHQQLKPTDDTRIVAPRTGRTPAPQRVVAPRPPSAPAPPVARPPADDRERRPVPAPVPQPMPLARDSRSKRASLAPQVAGFQEGPPGIKPWLLVIGAVIVAIAAFAITRAFIR